MTDEVVAVCSAKSPIAKTEGHIISPEGAATWKALLHLHKNKMIRADEKVLLLNTGSGYKYLDNLGLQY